MHFWMGTLTHLGMQNYYSKGRKVEPALKAMDKFIKVSMLEFQGTYKGAWEMFRQEVEDAADLCLSVMHNYSIYDEEDPFDGKVLAIEEKVRVPLGPGLNLSGRIDLVLESDTGIWVVDHKTAGSLYDLKGLDVDEQLTGYAYLLWKSRGVIPTGVLYNVLVKDLPAEPKVLKSGSLSQDKSQKTVYALYQSKIQELDLDPSDYTDYLTYLEGMGWSKFFQRDGATRNEHELLSFEERAKRKGEDIVAILKNPAKNAYPSPSTFRCSSCPYLGACKAMEDGGDYQSILNEHFLPNTYYS
jgi:hypothetical protein